MTESISLKLSINSSELARFCDKIIRRSRDMAKTHDALVTLETFLLLFAREAHGTNEYIAIEHLIKRYTEQTRSALMEQETQKLIAALQQQQATAISQIHTPMSRNGFYLILQTAFSQLSPAQQLSVKQWAIDCVKLARQKAEQASGYPEAYDFIKAGMSIEEFQAMEDVSRYLESF
ncbi:MAG: hypothetical protein ACN4GM_11825 [Gammaproteobacteria bacterium]